MLTVKMAAVSSGSFTGETSKKLNAFHYRLLVLCEEVTERPASVPIPKPLSRARAWAMYIWGSSTGA